jgi:hypothetical protein
MQQFNIKSGVIFLKDDMVGKTSDLTANRRLGEHHQLLTFMML